MGYSTSTTNGNKYYVATNTNSLYGNVTTSSTFVIDIPDLTYIKALHISPPTTQVKDVKIKKLTCENCGGAIDKESMCCKFCGSAYLIKEIYE